MLLLSIKLPKLSPMSPDATQTAGARSKAYDQVVVIGSLNRHPVFSQFRASLVRDARFLLNISQLFLIYF